MMRNVLRLRSLKSKIIMMFLVGASLVLLLQIGVFQRWISTIIVEKTDAYFQETVNQVGKRMDLQVKQFEATAIGIGANQVIKNYLRDINRNLINYNIGRYKIIRELLRQTNLDVIDNIDIYPLKQKPINFYYTEPNLETERYTRLLLTRNWGDEEQVVWKVFEQAPYRIFVFLPIRDEGETLGLLRISVNELFFGEILDEVQLGKEGKVFLVSGGSVVFSKERRWIHRPVSELPMSSGTSVGISLTNKDWTLVGIVPQKEVVGQINRFNRVFLLMVVTILAAVMLFALATARLILRPLKKIMKGMESIQRGNLNVMLVQDSNDEFSTIIRNFNYMVERINTLIETVYRQQLSYRKAEMQGLQAKLNPHFLYNTLDMIYWMLIVKEEDQIGEAIVALSGILRYSILHKNEFVTVGEDMGQLDNYLKIQKMRFHEKLHYAIHVQDEATDLKIPKLLIQPLVENAIKYAFQDMKNGGMLDIRGYIDGGDLFFEVADNGIGMPEEIRRSFQSPSERRNEESGIGIQLVHQRARYAYGEGYGISIKSAAGLGTKVTVKLRTKTEFSQEKLWSEDKGDSLYA